MIGAYLEHSGRRDRTRRLVDRANSARTARHGQSFWPVFLVGLPIFFEVGFIILVPLVYSLTREKENVRFWCTVLAMTAPLTVLHSLVPPHPAPAAAAQLPEPISVTPFFMAFCSRSR